MTQSHLWSREGDGGRASVREAGRAVSGLWRDGWVWGVRAWLDGISDGVGQSQSGCSSWVSQSLDLRGLCVRVGLDLAPPWPVCSAGLAPAMMAAKAYLPSGLAYDCGAWAKGPSSRSTALKGSSGGPGLERKPLLCRGRAGRWRRGLGWTLGV